MAFRERAERFGWSPAARRRRVLARAEREQARESEAARERLLRHAAGSGADQRPPAQRRAASMAVRVCPA